MVIYRVDDRLIHGQIVENWVGIFSINKILIINDSIYNDELRKNIMRFALPEDVELEFKKTSKCMDIVFEENKNYLVLFESLEDVKKAVEYGFKIDRLNLGGIHYAKGRNFTIGKALFLSEDECKIIKDFISKGIDVYMQAIPQENKIKVEEVI